MAQIFAQDSPSVRPPRDKSGAFRCIQRFKTGGYVSAQPVWADIDGDGLPELIAASDALYAWKLDGALVDGFPAYGSNYFASRPAIEDINRDGQPEIIVGCDDDCLYVFDNHGKLLPNWPQRTGGDVYSSPVIVDLDHDGQLEIIVGSDDGCVYAWKSSGELLPGWPQQTGGFVSASPKVADIDGDGCPEIIAGSWDGSVYAWRHDGTLINGWPQPTGHILWAAVETADIDGDGYLEIFAASDGIHGWKHNGTPLPGWPNKTRGFMVGAPVIFCAAAGDPHIMSAGDRLYCWDATGKPMSGFPIELDGFCWHQPVLTDVDGDGTPEIVIGTWAGTVRAYSLTGHEIALPYATNGPIFAAPAPVPAPVSDGGEFVVSSWDGELHWLKFEHSHDSSDSDSNPGYRQEYLTLTSQSRDLGSVPESVPLFVQVDGPISSHGTLYYWKSAEARPHPSPLVIHKGKMTGLVQPYLSGATVELWAEVQQPDGTTTRYPEHGTASYHVSFDFLGRVKRRLKRLGVMR